MLKFPTVAGVIILAAFPIENGNVSARSNSLTPSLYNETIVKDNTISVIENVGYILAAVDAHSAMCDQKVKTTSDRYLDATYYSLLTTYDWGTFVKNKAIQVDARTEKGIFFELVKESYYKNIRVMQSGYAIPDICDKLLVTSKERSNQLEEIRLTGETDKPVSPFKEFVKDTYIVKNGAIYSSALLKITLPLSIDSINVNFPTDEALKRYVDTANSVHDSSLQTMLLSKIYYDAFKYPRNDPQRIKAIKNIIEDQSRIVESILTPISAEYSTKFFQSEECRQLIGNYCAIGKNGGIVAISSVNNETKYVILQNPK